MYQFRIVKQLDGGYRFELGNIKMFIDSYSIVNNKHHLTNPGKAIAYFNTEDNVYGISNEPNRYDTAEAFFDAIALQYQIFQNPPKGENNSRQHYA